MRSPAPTKPIIIPIPGGGRILFSTHRGIGVVEADGSQSHFGRWRVADAYWDPLHPGDILVSPYTDGPPRLRRYRLTGRAWLAVRNWSVGYGEFTQISPDGRWFAYSLFVKGRMTWTIRVTGRDGTAYSIYRRHISPLGWTPDNRVILSDWRAQGVDLLWDPFRGTIRRVHLLRSLADRLPTGARHVSTAITDLSWSSDGHFFAGLVFWRLQGKYREGVAIGTLAKGVLKVIPAGGASSVPVWSPTRPEVGFVSSWSSGGPTGELHRYDASTGLLALVDRGLSINAWVAWSPTGDWMLLDQGPERWLFVSRDGRHVVDYPMLGYYPRWAAPGFSLHITVC